MVEVDRYLLAYLLFGLVLIRTSGLAVFAPFFGAEQFPMRVRVLMAVFLAIPLYPMAGPSAVLPPVLDTPELAILALQELSIGLSIGFIATMVFMAVQLAGQLIGTQIGFTMANVLDPLTNLEVSLVGFFKMNLALVIFLVANLHLGVIQVVQYSFERIPIGTLAFPTALRALPQIVVVEGHTLLVHSLQLAAPILVIMLLDAVVVGIITRTMPQMNIMVLDLPLRVALGITLLMLLVPALVRVIEDDLHGMLVHLRDLVLVFSS